MEDVQERRKQITFDLNQARLKEHYPRKKPSLNPIYYKHAYDDIKRHMLKNGFEWIQYSVYVSKEPMSFPQLVGFMQVLSEKMPWLHVCANDIVATDVISKKYNLKPFMERALEHQIDDMEIFTNHEAKKECKQTDVSEKKPPLQSKIAAANCEQKRQLDEKKATKGNTFENSKHSTPDIER